MEVPSKADGGMDWRRVVVVREGGLRAMGALMRHRQSDALEADGKLLRVIGGDAGTGA
jgi:hypothetical protein